MLLVRRKSTIHRWEGPQIYSMSTDIRGLVTYSKVKRTNRGQKLCIALYIYIYILLVSLTRRYSTGPLMRK